MERAPPPILGPLAVDRVGAEFLVAGGAITRPASGVPPRPEHAAPVIGAAGRALIGVEHRAYAFPAVLPSFAEWADGIPDLAALQRRLPAVLRHYLPRGAYLTVDLKPLHWLGYGVAERIPALFRENDAVIAGDSSELIGRYAPPRELVLSGLVWPEAVGYIAETAYLIRERHGQGQFIGFAHDAAFRGYSLGTQRLLLNAVVLGPGMRKE
jgi:hypothetical protein